MKKLFSWIRGRPLLLTLLVVLFVLTMPTVVGGTSLAATEVMPSTVQSYATITIWTGVSLGHQRLVLNTQSAADQPDRAMAAVATLNDSGGRLKYKRTILSTDVNSDQTRTLLLALASSFNPVLPVANKGSTLSTGSTLAEVAGVTITRMQTAETIRAV